MLSEESKGEKFFAARYDERNGFASLGSKLSNHPTYSSQKTSKKRSKVRKNINKCSGFGFS